MKYLATSTMHEVSSMTIMPPEPMNEPTLDERLVVDRHVEELGRDAAARRAAGLDRLERAGRPTIPPPMSNDDLAQGRAHRHLDQAGVDDLAGQREDLGALALLGADGGEPVAAVADDRRDVGERLDVVDQRRAGPRDPTPAGIRRARERRAAPALDRGDQRRLLAADEGAGAEADVDLERELACPRSWLPRKPARRPARMAVRSRLTASGYSPRQ